MSRFETFKEIEIGGSDKEELLRKLDKADVKLNEYAKILFEHKDFSPSMEIEKVTLIKVNLKDLELSESCSYDDFETQAQKLGLRLCPLELAVYLRLEFMDQAKGPYLKIASERLERSDEFPKGLYLRNVDNSLWLRGYRADGFEGWPDNYAFIFIDK